MRAITPGASLFLAILMIAHLLASCVGTSFASDNSVRKSLIDNEQTLYDTVKSKAEEESIPVTVSKEVADSVLYGHYKKMSELEWTALGEVVVGHFANNLESIRNLGETNQAILIASMRVNAKDVKVEVTAMGTSFYGVASTLSTVCGVSVTSEDEFGGARFTVHSGGVIPVLQACRFYAWVLAAGGIAIDSKGGEEHSIILVHSVLQGEDGRRP